MTDTTFQQIMALLIETYAVEFSDERLRVWRMLLDPLPDGAAREAVVTLCRTSPYPPKPADLFRIVHGSPADAEHRLDEEAELAVVHLEQHICDYRMCDFGPELNAVMRAMNGIDAIVAMMDTGGWRFERTRARTLYRAYRRRQLSAEEGAPVIPLALAANLAAVPLSVYMERGIPLPIVRAPFGESPLPALEAGESP